MAALRHMRRAVPQLSLLEVKDYVDAVRDGGEPAEELISRTRDKPRRTYFAIETLAGPVRQASEDR